MSRKSDSGSDTDSVYDMPSGKWVVSDKVRGTSEGVQKNQTKSKKSVYPTVNFDKGCLRIHRKINTVQVDIHQNTMMIGIYFSKRKV